MARKRRRGNCSFGFILLFGAIFGALLLGAINAVQKAERFPELQDLPTRVFEQNFRRFTLLFKPEDLRF